MNDIRLNNILRRYRPLSNIFKGVFGKNELAAIPIPAYPFCIISNESDFGTKGTHWVAIFFDKHGNCDYFDSYGQMPMPDTEMFIKHYAKGIIQMNKRQIQSLGSDVCGQYCIYYLSKRAVNQTMNQIISVFHEDRRRDNDIYVLDYVHNKFNC